MLFRSRSNAVATPAGLSAERSQTMADMVTKPSANGFAKHAAPFVGLVGSGSIYLHKHVALEVRYEVGGGIDYNDYLIMDNRPPKSVGYSSLQGSLLFEF